MWFTDNLEHECVGNTQNKGDSDKEIASDYKQTQNILQIWDTSDSLSKAKKCYWYNLESMKDITYLLCKLKQRNNLYMI